MEEKNNNGEIQIPNFMAEKNSSRRTNLDKKEGSKNEIQQSSNHKNSNQQHSRSEFAKSLKVDVSQRNQHSHPDDQTAQRILNKTTRQGEHNNQSKKQSSKTDKKKIKNQPKKIQNKTYKEKNNKRLKSIIKKIILGTITVATIASVANNRYENSRPISLEKAMEIETPEELGIDQNLSKELKELQSKLDSKDFSNTELIEIAQKINNLQFDTIKSKTANELGVGEGQVEIWISSTTSDPDGTGIIKIKNENGDIFSDEYVGNSNIREYIKDTAKMQDILEKVPYTNISTNEIAKECKSAIKSIDKCAASTIKFTKGKNDSHNTVTMQYIPEKDYKTRINNKINKQIDNELSR